MGIPPKPPVYSNASAIICYYMLLHAITMLIYAAYLIAGGTFPAMLKKARGNWMCRWDV